LSNGQGGRLTKNERREQAREEMRRKMEAARRKERTGKVLLQGGIILAVVAVAVVVALVIINSVGPKGPGPRNMASGGVLFQPGAAGEVQVAKTAGLADEAERVMADSRAELQVQVFVDFLCPLCGRFERGITPEEFQASGFPGTAADYTGNADYIKTLIKEGVASLEVVPVAILDRYSLGTKYSTRAANAFACVVDQEPGIAMDYMGLLFEQQPDEGTSGLDDNELIALARDAGSSSAATELCIRNQSFKSFIADNTNTASSKAEFANLVADDAYTGPIGTPVVYVNGKRFTPEYDWSNNASFRTFIQQLLGEEYQESQPQPTPTPTSTPTP